ncbi:MAG: Uma2 family endonuclease [Thermosynechococcaceae cyanobacterium]
MGRVFANPQAIDSFDDLLELEELTGVKYELIDGQVVAMTGGTKAHNLIALGLFTEIDAQKDEQCRLYVADVKLRINEQLRKGEKDTSTYPDVMLACGEEESDLYEEHPLLLAEVLSDSTARKDKGDKRDKYLELPSLYAFLILSQTEIMVTLYQREGNEWVQNVFLGKDTTIHIQLGDNHRPLTLSLGKIYRSVADRI